LDLRRQPDAALVQRAQQGPDPAASRAAVEELFGRYEERVYAWCFRMVRERERALDLSQDALLAAYRALPGFEGRCQFSSWLYGITRHSCLRGIQRERLRRQDPLDPELPAEADDDPVREFESQEELSRVLTMCEDRLEPQERLALWLRCEEELPLREIEAILGLRPASGARGLLQTARRKLRAALRARPGSLKGGEP
jgi:RNA polymerase sigma-70 factor (ECF subfamily)